MTGADDIRSLGSAVDSHLHLWDIADPWVRWIHDEADWMPVIGRDFTPRDAVHSMGDAGIDRAILVETGMHREENERLLSIARSADWVEGAVIWIDLASRRVAEQAIAAQVAGERLVVGTRHWEGNPRMPRSLRDHSTIDAIESLAAEGLALDFFSADFRDLELVLDLTRRMEGLHIVVNHLGKPKIADASGFASWARLAGELAQCPDVFFKLSGWATRVAHISAEQVRPYASFLVREAGPERLMFASNWPVSLTVGDYAETAFASFDALDEAPAARRQVFCDAARRAYRLQGDPSPIRLRGSTCITST